MKITLLDGMDSNKPFADAIKANYDQLCDELAYFDLQAMDVNPCRSCGSCGHRTPGQCIMKDDIDVIFPELVSSDVVVMLTPIRFGGYSAELKKVVDKFMLLGLPLYMVQKGHLLHPPRYDKKHLIVIGVKEREIEGQEEAFQTMAEHNALNLLYTHETIIFDADVDTYTISQRLGSAAKEVVA